VLTDPLPDEMFDVVCEKHHGHTIAEAEVWSGEEEVGDTQINRAARHESSRLVGERSDPAFPKVHRVTGEPGAH